MNSLIDPAESAYIKWRSILDNIFYAHEIFYQAGHSPNLKDILCKLVFSKVFDKLYLKYIIRLLKHRRFLSKWVLWLEIKHSFLFQGGYLYSR